MSIFDPNVAKRVVDYILSTNDDILAVSIIDMKGNILAANSDHVRKELGVSVNEDKYNITLVVSALSLIHVTRDIIEEAKAVITIHKDCKLMLLPLPSFQILVGLILRGSVNAVDYNIANKIERLIADTLWHI
ncbi:MAG TPA: hypothetical protein VHG34_03380 [Nitrososphaeraceae archaeon]|nr:hypothetical protein [Nitrososphaeraceae archaeon]